MSKTCWVVEGPDDTLEVQGRKYASNDDGAPMMCNLVCQRMGRHVHIDYCRATNGASCTGAEVEHIRTRLAPNPDKAKDSITHSLYWRRSGAMDFWGIWKYLQFTTNVCRFQRSEILQLYPR
jgi:hypothetical protein